MKYLSVLPILLAAAPARAHVGHLAEVAGHGHLLGAAAAAAAAAVAIWAGLKGKSSGAEEAEADDDAEPQEA